MMRFLGLGVLLIPSLAAALLQEPLPGYGSTSTSETPVANTLYCVTAPAWMTINGTKLAGDVATGTSSSTTGFGVYPDSDGGTALGTVSGSSATAGTITGTGLTINLVAGTRYRICVCTTSTAVRWTALRDLTGSFTPQASLLNAVATTTIGTAANACTSGVPPSTTGAIAGSATQSIPLVLVEE